MTLEQLRLKLREQPFKPFRLMVTDGSGYDVLHPEMLFVTKNRITVAIYDQAQDTASEVAPRDAVISPLHITSMVELPPASASANGGAV